ncbi:MAG TPA: hypothetical protein VKD72_04335, partial [Gemmataceae bacterium]|nr:hypothetical protein [Gemmataceae bacterium]
GTISGPLLTSLAATGVVLGAWYMLTLVRGVFFGEVHEPHHEGHAVHDLNAREIALLVPIAVSCLLIGLFPQPIIKTAAPEIKYVVTLAIEAKGHPSETQRSQTSSQSDARQVQAPLTPLPRGERGERGERPERRDKEPR